LREVGNDSRRVDSQVPAPFWLVLASQDLDSLFSTTLFEADPGECHGLLGEGHLADEQVEMSE